MPRLNFDFHARPSRPSLPVVLLALAGVTAVAWSWTSLHAARATEAGLAMRIAALERPPAHATVKRTTPVEDAARITRARVETDLAYSWQPAFDALAAARGGKIALVSLDAVQAKSQLRLVAEARRLADAIAYIDVLQQQPGVRRVELLQHEVQIDDAQKPLRVSILVELRP